MSLHQVETSHIFIRHLQMFFSFSIKMGFCTHFKILSLCHLLHHSVIKAQFPSDTTDAAQAVSTRNTLLEQIPLLFLCLAIVLPMSVASKNAGGFSCDYLRSAGCVQNGSVLDGLQLWKRNVDKHFEGVEECYICYSVLHGSSYQLPRKQCRTCRKRFHAECLYRWFDTSNNSACPLCRNLFQTVLTVNERTGTWKPSQNLTW